MLFCSEQFFFFFCAVFVVYWAIPSSRLRVWLLLAASFFFYATWNHWLAGIIVVSTTIDYAIARALDSSSSPRWRKLLLGISLTGNLGLLAYFKYANFFLQSLEQSLRALGSSSSMPVLRVILPIGISFYTFEAISYTVDVYRRRIKAERNLSHFMLFILFFPHLVAGPIVRARDFLPQIRRHKRWNWARLQLGMQYLIMGLIKKLVIADRMALFSDPVFADPSAYGTAALWLAVLAYAFQVYCDFSGYSDMALGTAHMLGYRLAQNFNLPYLAANMTELWQRWHMSLSSWLRDYVFFPLIRSGRSKKGSARQWIRNNGCILLTMTLCGLWHGASFTFIVWGAFHGMFQIVQRSFQSFCRNRPRLDGLLLGGPGTALRIALTFLTWSLSGILFRSTSLASAATMFGRMITPHSGPGTGAPVMILWSTAAAIALCHVLGQNDRWKDLLRRLPAPVVGTAYAGLISLALLLAPDTSAVFVYFQF
jgi:alginate O-acetyltransferase complex protein AlgI